MTLYMPKFENEFNEDMLSVLNNMGIRKACDGRYGLRSISDDINVLAFFKHAVKIIVDEEGTETAGASMAGIDNAVGPNDSMMSFNRPFIYLIEVKNIRRRERYVLFSSL